MTLLIVSSATLVVLAVLLWRHRVRYLTERPFEHDRRAYSGGRELAEAMAKQAGLTAVQGPVGFAWLADFLLWPVLLLWGDLRLSRAETQLARWTLVGKRGERDVTIQLDPDRVTIRETANGAHLGASASQPLEQEEHLRTLHPIGSDAWTSVTAKITALFALGVDEVKSEYGGVSAIVPREKLTLEKLGAVLDALDAFASAI